MTSMMATLTAPIDSSAARLCFAGAGASVVLSLTHFFSCRVSVTEDVPVTFSILGRPVRSLPNACFAMYPMLVGVEALSLVLIIIRGRSTTVASAATVASGIGVTLLAQVYAAKIGSRTAVKMPAWLSLVSIAAVVLPCAVSLRRDA